MIMIPTSNNEPTAAVAGWIGLHGVDDRPQAERGFRGGVIGSAAGLASGWSGAAG